MTLQELFAVIGALLAVEGVLLMTINKESWRRFCAFISSFSAGQVHTVGAIMLALGALLLFLSAI